MRVTALNDSGGRDPRREAGAGERFESAFQEASLYIAATPSYVSHELQRCVEDENRYILLVHWRTLEDHTEGFRGSDRYEEWRRLLHHFYEPFPTVQHFERIFSNPA